MRDRYGDGAGKGGSAVSTLDQLNQALDQLESRMGLGAPQSRGHGHSYANEIDMVRARQAELDRANRAPRQPQAQPQVQPHAQPRYAAQPQQAYQQPVYQQPAPAAPAPDFSALVSEIRAMRSDRSSQNEMQSLRQDIEGLKSQLLVLARDETVRDLSDRWTSFEREMSALPQQLASREDLHDMLARLDDMRDMLNHMPSSMPVEQMEGRIAQLAQAVTALVDQQANRANDEWAQFDARLDEIANAVAVMNSAGRIDVDAIDRIEARLGSLQRQMEEVPQSATMPDYEPHFAAISRRIEEMQAAASHIQQPQASPDLDMMIGRLDYITDAVNALANQPAAEIPADAFSALDHRFAELTARLDQFEGNNAPEITSAINSIDSRMDEIARRLDAYQQEQAAVPGIAQLEDRLSEITNLLMATPVNASMPTPDFSHLESQIANLTAQLATMPMDGGAAPQPAINEAELVAAVRRAAEEAVAASAPGSVDTAFISGLSDQLIALENIARDTDDRNERTFEAIHDTLLKIVDHLAGLEDAVFNAPAPATEPSYAPAAAAYQAEQPRPAMPAASYEAEEHYEEPETAHAQSYSDQPAFEDDYQPVEETLTASRDDLGEEEIGMPMEPGQVPSMRLEVNDAPSMMSMVPPRRKAMSPAHAAATAASMARDEMAQDLPEEASEKQSKSLIASFAKKLKRSSSKTKGKAGKSAAVADPEFNEFAGEEETADKGSEVAAIMERVRRERQGFAAAQDDADGANANVAKSDFIAAARRAAKAAADTANIPDAKKETKSKSLFANLGGKRRPILMGAAAILLAVLALPMLKDRFMPSTQVAQAPAPVVEQQVEQPPVEEAARVVTPATDTNAAAGESDAATVQAMTPATDTTAENTSVAQSATAETGDDVAMADGAADQETASALPQIDVAEIPEAAGPIAFREAVADGEPMAMFLLGDYYSKTGQYAGTGASEMENAAKWYELAAEQGFAPAQHRIGSYYEKGLGVERSLTVAKTWYQLAAEQGNVTAMHNLGVLYANGVDGQPDPQSASRWFLKAAERGASDSQFNLGVMAARGQGLDQSLVESYKWFALSANAGDEEAAAKRDIVAESMDPESLEMARGAVALWKAKEADPEANSIAVPDEWRTDAAMTAATPAPANIDMKKAIRNIQAILNNNGYDAGPVDGVMGGKTREAIKAFQAANGMAATGNVDQQLVEKLLELNG